MACGCAHASGSSLLEPYTTVCIGLFYCQYPNRTSGVPMPAPTRTTRDAWIDAGLSALAEGGPDAVRVDVLAQTLGVTRGGFYHQFDDRQALLDALLDTWETRSTDDVLDRVEREGGDPRTKVTRAGALT